MVEIRALIAWILGTLICKLPCFIHATVGSGLGCLLYYYLGYIITVRVQDEARYLHFELVFLFPFNPQISGRPSARSWTSHLLLLVAILLE